MSDTNKFRVTYSADDGYAGGARPLHFSISRNDIEGDETDADLKDMFWRCVEDDFAEKVRAVSKDEEKFVEWARAIIEAEKQ